MFIHKKFDEDQSSLPAILMNEEYYNFTMEHSHTLESDTLCRYGKPWLKAKAYPDPSTRKAKNKAMDKKNIRKHRSDIFRLVATSGKDTWLKLPA